MEKKNHTKTISNAVFSRAHVRASGDALRQVAVEKQQPVLMEIVFFGGGRERTNSKLVFTENHFLGVYLFGKIFCRTIIIRAEIYYHENQNVRSYLFGTVFIGKNIVFENMLSQTHLIEILHGPKF